MMLFAEEEKAADKEKNVGVEECCDSCSCEDHKPSEVDNLKAEIFLLKSELEILKEEQNDKIMEFVDKKSKEAASIIAAKEAELEEKYRSEYDAKSKYMYEKPLSEFSDIVSQFELVINSVNNPEVANYLAGFKMFLSQMHSLLDSFSITEINPKVGDEYDSDFMEAFSTNDVETADLDNKITKVLKKGYRLHERIIKLASVEVGKFKI